MVVSAAFAIETDDDDDDSEDQGDILTDKINSSTHFFQFIRTDVRTVCETKVEQNPLSVVIRTLPRNTSVVHEIPRTTDIGLAKRSCPLLFPPCQVTNNISTTKLTQVVTGTLCIVVLRRLVLPRSLVKHTSLRKF